MANGVKRSRENTVLYLYGITKTVGKLTEKIIGVDGLAPIENIRCAGLICWTSRVAKAEFADNLSKNIENLSWLAEMSRRHQNAVAAIAEEHDILPARFGTVFLNESSLLADVESRKSVLQADLRRIKGNQEWGVKVFATPFVSVKIPTAKTGKNYLEAKSALLRRNKPEGDDEEITQFAKELQDFSVALAEGGKISGGRRDLRYQVSLLLKREQRKKLETVLKHYSRAWQGVRKIECTGPWPPYSFVSRASE